MSHGEWWGDPNAWRRPSIGDFVPLFWALLIGYITYGVNHFAMPPGIRALVTAGLLALCAVLVLQAVKALRRWPAYWAEKEVTGQVIARGRSITSPTPAPTPCATSPSMTAAGPGRSAT